MILKLSRGFLTHQICLVFCCVFMCAEVAALLVIAGRKSCKVKRVVGALLICAIVMYLFLNVYLTVFSRIAQTGIPEINMELFWSYRASICFKHIIPHVIPRTADIYWQIALNILFYMPFGCLVTSICCVYMKKRVVWLTVPIGFLLSMVTEYCQYRYGIGLCEIDDVFDNGIGYILGIALTLALLDISNRWINKRRVIQ